MIRVATRLSLRHAAQHRLRTLFTIVGIALGVAAIVGIRLVNDSAARSFNRAVQRLAGSAVLQVSNGDAGVPEALLDELQKVPGVSVAAPSVEGPVPLANFQGERLYVFGVDLLNGDSLRKYAFEDTSVAVKDKLAFLAQPDSIALTTKFLKAHRLSSGDTIRVLAEGEAKTLTIRGVLTIRKGPATLFDGRLGVMDVFAAQRLLGFTGRFSRIDIGAARGVDLATLEAAVKRLVGGRGVVERPERSSKTLERMLAGNRVAYSIGAALALVVGVYLVFNTMLIAVAQRRRELAILRAAGMRRREVMRAIMGEALVLGALGCVIGAPLGVVFARATSAAFAADVSRRLIPIDAGKILVSPGTIALGVVLGLLATLVATLIPARQALGVRPAEALGRLDLRAARPPTRRMTAAGISLLVLGFALFGYESVYGMPVAAAGGNFYYGVEFCLLIGVSLVAPALLEGAARGVERLVRGWRGPLAMLAARRLRMDSRRFSIAAVALAVSLSGALTIASLTSSMYGTVIHWFDENFGKIDLLVSTSPVSSTTNATTLPASLARGIARLPDVESVDASRWLRISYRGQLIELVGRAARAYQNGFRALDLMEGAESRALAAFQAERGVLVNDTFSRRFGTHVGDVVRLKSPSGNVALRVVGVTFDLQELGEVIVPQGLYRRLWKDDTITALEVRLRRPLGSQRARAASDAEVETVAAQIRREWGRRYGLFVTTPSEFREWIESVVAKAIGAAYPIIVVAICIALLGLINSLFASVLDRIREIGTLRAIGATRAQIVRLIVAEAAVVGLVGGAAGVALGSLEGYRFVTGTLRDVIGIGVFFHYPTWAIVFSLAAALLLAGIAGYLPGRAAGKVRVTDALEHE